MAGVWSGYLTFGMVTLPVRLFSGARGERVNFHLLHAPDHVRLKQQLYCPQHERAVARDEVIRGYEYARGEYVVVDEEEIRQAAPETQQQMEIIEFCHAGDLDPIWFESSYYLLPEAAGRRAYALLEEALRSTGRIGICRVAMHNREYVCALRPSDLAGFPSSARDGKGRHNHGLLLHTLFYLDELQVTEGFGERAADAAPQRSELELARRLIEGLTHPFDPRRFHDRYRENLERIVAAHLEGREIPAPRKPPQPAAIGDLMESLKESLRKTGS